MPTTTDLLVAVHGQEVILFSFACMISTTGRASKQPFVPCLRDLLSLPAVDRPRVMAWNAGDWDSNGWQNARWQAPLGRSQPLPGTRLTGRPKTQRRQWRKRLTLQHHGSTAMAGTNQQMATTLHMHGTMHQRYQANLGGSPHRTGGMRGRGQRNPKMRKRHQARRRCPRPPRHGSTATGTPPHISP